MTITQLPSISPQLLSSGREPSMQWGRMERRTPIALVVHLATSSEPAARETAWIENISSRGARVISDRSWRISDRVLLSSLDYGVRSAAASVVYCQPHPEERFAIGLRFDHSVFESMAGTALEG